MQNRLLNNTPRSIRQQFFFKIKYLFLFNFILMIFYWKWKLYKTIVQIIWLGHVFKCFTRKLFLRYYQQQQRAIIHIGDRDQDCQDINKWSMLVNYFFASNSVQIIKKKFDVYDLFVCRNQILVIWMKCEKTTFFWVSIFVGCWSKGEIKLNSNMFNSADN